MVAGNDPEVVLAAGQQTADGVLAAENTLSGREPSGRAAVPFQDDVVGVLVVCQVRRVIPVQRHHAGNLLHGAQVHGGARDVWGWGNRVSENDSSGTDYTDSPQVKSIQLTDKSYVQMDC